MTTIKTWAALTPEHSSDGEYEEIDVEVIIGKFYRGARATYWEPAEDPYIEVDIFDMNGVNVEPLLTPESIDRIYDLAWEYMTSD